MDDQQIYERLRKVRRSRGISVDQLAERIGENSQKVGRIERGQRSLTVDYLLKISKALSTPLESLLENREDKKEDPVITFDSNILNSIVMLIEEISVELEYSLQEKAKMISKIYEIILKLPNENRNLFFRLFREGIKALIFDR